MELLRHDLCESTDAYFVFCIFLFIAIGFFLAICVFVIVSSNEKTYEDGQIDALNGKEKYYLKEFANGERRWIERESIVFPEDHLISK